MLQKDAGGPLTAPTGHVGMASPLCAISSPRTLSSYTQCLGNIRRPTCRHKATVNSARSYQNSTDLGAEYTMEGLWLCLCMHACILVIACVCIIGIHSGITVHM